MIPERLSALDASFLAVESQLAPMHVGWVATFDPPEHGPAPTAEELAAHIGARLDGAHRYRQRLADVPLGVHDPVWIDDPGFDPARHVHAVGELDVDGELSTPLARDRPLWEMWVADDLTLLGKAHHCMVDGLAVVELGNLLLDADPEAGAGDAEAWAAQPAPTPGQRLGRAIADRIGETASLVDVAAAAGRQRARAARDRADGRPHAAAAGAGLAAQRPRLRAAPARARDPHGRRGAPRPQALRRDPERRGARRLRRRAAPLPRRAAARSR